MIPATWGFVRLGAGEEAGTRAAPVAEEADDAADVVEVIMLLTGEFVGRATSTDEDEERDDDTEADVIRVLKPKLALDTVVDRGELLAGAERNVENGRWLLV